MTKTIDRNKFLDASVEATTIVVIPRTERRAMFKATVHLDEVLILKRALGATRDEAVEWFVNVFDYQADLYLIHADNYILVVDIVELDKTQFETLVTLVVCDDNAGALTQSGLYFPTSETSRQAFVQLMTTAIDWAQFVHEYTDDNDVTHYAVGRWNQSSGRYECPLTAAEKKLTGCFVEFGPLSYMPRCKSEQEARELARRLFHLGDYTATEEETQ